MVLDLRKMAAPLANTVEIPERSSMGMLMYKPPARGAYIHSRVSLLYGVMRVTIPALLQRYSVLSSATLISLGVTFLMFDIHLTSLQKFREAPASAMISN